MIKARLHLAVLAVAAFLLLSQRATAQSYTVVDLGTLGTTISYSYSQAFGINASNEVVGQTSDNNKATPDPAFLYTNGKMTSLGTLGGEYSTAESINSSGQIAGYSTLADGRYRAFLYMNGTMTDIGTLGGSEASAYAINSSGQIVGASYTAAGQGHAFLYSNGKMTDLGTLGGNSSVASGINTAGLIVGQSYNAAGNFRGFLYANGKMTDLGTLGGDWSIANAINDSKQITGQAYTKSNFASHAFLYVNGKMTDLGVLPGGFYSVGLAINNSGVIVGQSTVPGGETLVYHAFIYSGGKMKDLNSLIPKGSGVLLQAATGINDGGHIVAYGTAKNGELHGFLLNPK